MQPPPSAIVFSVSSGAGYGLLFVLAALTPMPILPGSVWFTLVAFSLALLLVTAGLIASALHAGPPEQAQGPSWSSRGRAAAIATYPIAALFAVERILRADTGLIDGATLALAAATAALAAATIFCTAMVYASLPTVPRWHNRWVVPNFLAHGLMTGALWLLALVHLFGGATPLPGLVTLAAISLAGILKLVYWRSADRGTAPGGRSAPAPTEKQRLATAWMAFALPALLIIVSGFAGAGLPASLLALAAAASANGGILIERWLFLAEARA